jgi:3-phenylpropionate/trans-cinnamate dioxygenase ferredoxin reductase subunit
MSKQTFVIVGASLAGAKAAEELRTRGFDGRVVLIGSEAERPYERPPLSKGYLQGESHRESVFLHEEGFYAQHEIELLMETTATSIDVGRSRVTLADGGELEYDRLLLSTGAEPRRLTVPGAELDGIYYLRTLADCDMLRERLVAGGHVVVVGAGWIGSEFAASARQRGVDVTVIDPQPLPNGRIFGPDIGAFYRDVHVGHGVEMLLDEAVESFEGDGAVTKVHTSARVVECGFVVAGIGVTPRVQLARDAGLEVENGVLVDEQLRTSSPNVFAAGDVANLRNPFYEERVRVEHWANALNQGPAAARAMLGETVSYDTIPYFFSDQYDVGMEYSGYVPTWDEVVFRGEPASGEFIAFWLREERVAAGMNVNVWDVNEQIQALIRSRAVVSVAALKDPDVPLESLAGELATGT